MYFRHARLAYLSTKTEPQTSPSTSQNLKVTNRLPLKDLRNAWGRTSSPVFDVAKMKYVLDHDNHEMRDDFREFIKQPLFQPRFDLTLEEEREVALQRLKACCDGGFISVLDFKNNPLKVFAAHELAVIDPAMGTKMTVQFNLFGGTVLKLGTERHHDVLLSGIDTLEEVGCFGLTELGYGNNAVEMETTATYDSKTDELTNYSSLFHEILGWKFEKISKILNNELARRMWNLQISSRAFQRIFGRKNRRRYSGERTA